MPPQKNTTVLRVCANVGDVYLSAAQARTWISRPNNAVESNEVYADIVDGCCGGQGKLSHKLLGQISECNATAALRCGAAITGR